MNQAQRKILTQLSIKLTDLNNELEGVITEEEEKLDSMPEGLRNGEQGQAAEEAVDKLKEARDSLETTVGCIDEASGG